MTYIKAKIIKVALVLIWLSLSACKVTGGEDQGQSLSTLNSSDIVVDASCDSSVKVENNYFCAPKVEVKNSALDTSELSWQVASDNTCSWLNINSFTGEISGSPLRSQTGDCQFSFQLVLAGELFSAHIINVNVLKPEIIISKSSCLETIQTQTPFNCSFAASTDISSPRFEWSLASNNSCSWLVIDSKTGRVSGAPGLNNVGNCILAVKANLENVSEKTTELSLTVPAPIMNVDVSACSAQANLDVAYGCTAVANATNIASPTFSWSKDASNKCSWVNINALSGQISGTPNINQTGDCLLAIRTSLAPNVYKVATKTVSVPVPVITINSSLCGTTVKVGEAYVCTASATATLVAKQNFTWSLDSSNTCAWANINAGNGQISGTPTLNQTGTCVLAIRALLSGAVAKVQKVNVTVPAPSINVSVAACSSVVNVGILYSCATQAAVVGITNVQLSYSLTSNTCSGLSINSSTGAISGIANISAIGPCSFKANATIVGTSISGSYTKPVQVLPAGFAEESILADLNSTTGDNFGSSVAIDGNFAVVGAPISSAGKAYFLEKINGVWLVKFALNPTGDDYEDIGRSVGISGDTIMVGAPSTDIGSVLSGGAVVIFRRNAQTGLWTQKAAFYNPDPKNIEKFGMSVHIEGDTAMIGGDTGITAPGAIYVYKKINGTWEFKQRIVSPAVKANSLFGIQVSFSGDLMVVGAPAESGGGAAYVYKQINGSWQLLQTLTAANSAKFGSTVSTNGSIVVVGDPYAANSGFAAGGLAHLYKLNGNSMSLIQSLGGPKASSSAHLGSCVSVKNNQVTIGASGSSIKADSAGAAFVYALNSVTNIANLTSTLVSKEAKSNDAFGSACATDVSNNVIIGTALGDLYKSNSGNVSIFKKQ